ncbi:MAG: sigma-70 family RNA polymerase sigma factor, partial [Candidatus Poribacteria bacterium]
MRDPADRELVRASQLGSSAAFDVLLRRYDTTVYAVTFGSLLDHRDAEDAAQNAFLRAWDRLETLRQPESFAAWMARIAHTCVADLRRRQSRDVVMDVHTEFAEEPNATVDQEQYAVREDIERLVEAGLRSLPESQRIALTMRYIGRRSYAEIAECLSLTQNAAHRRV